MLDAKRLAEQMQPEKLRELAGYLDGENGEFENDGSGCRVETAKEDGALLCAAAVLREVAGREEAKRSNSVPAQEGDYTQDASRYAAMQGDKPTITEDDGGSSVTLVVEEDAPTNHRHYHDRLTREIAHAVLHLIDPEETEPRSKVFDHLLDAYQDAKQMVESATSAAEKRKG